MALSHHGTVEKDTATRLAQDTHVPLYAQIRLILESRILSGEIRPDTVLPGEHELAEDFGVSRITAKRALDDLASAGLVKRERGRGTRVLARKDTPTVQTSIDGWLENIDHMQRTTAVRLLDFAWVTAPAEIASALDLPPQSQVLRTVRVRSLDGAPMSHLVSYLPEPVGRGINADDLGTTPLLKLLEHAGITVAAARQSISACLAAPEIAQALGVHAGAPLLEVRRVVRDDTDTPVQSIRALYRPELYRVDMSMTRIAGPSGMGWSANGPEETAT